MSILLSPGRALGLDLHMELGSSPDTTSNLTYSFCDWTTAYALRSRPSWIKDLSTVFFACWLVVARVYGGKFYMVCIEYPSCQICARRNDFSFLQTMFIFFQEVSLYNFKLSKTLDIFSTEIMRLYSMIFSDNTACLYDGRLTRATNSAQYYQKISYCISPAWRRMKRQNSK